MKADIYTALLAVTVLSTVLTGFIRKLSLMHGVLDIPNERSSHRVPTPRGGGLAIVVATTVAVGVLGWMGVLALNSVVALCGAIPVAAVGFIDDRRSVRPTVRLAVHTIAAVWAVAWLGGLAPLQFGAHSVQMGVGGYLLASFGIVWTLNLFNFMDGIDGIAVSEAVFIAFAAAALGLASGHGDGVLVAAALFGAACCGFLFWNWPPARIFMGDVGSGYLGYVLAVLAIAQQRTDPAALWIWLLLGGAFFVDATVTLVRRLLRLEHVHQAHRSHAYQRLARRWDSHLRMTLAVIVLNLAWILPLAWIATRHPQVAAWVALIGLVPIAVVAIAAGAGQDDAPPS